MGKVKNKKFKSLSSSPIGASQEVEEKEVCGPEYSVVKNLLEKIQSTHSEEKECSCTTIANLVCQPNTVGLFLNANAVKILGPLILDEKITVQKSALGALRNMTVGGNCYDVCEEMVKQDIMTPLVALLMKIKNEEQTEELLKLPENVEVISQAVHLLWNVCESSEVAVKIFNQQSLSQVLVMMMKNCSILPTSLLLAILQCLFTVSESNSVLCQALYEDIQLFHSIVNTQHKNPEELLIQVNALGILQNILSCVSDLDTSVVNEVNTKTVSLIRDILLIEVKDMLSEALVILEKLKNADIVPSVIPSEDESHDIETVHEEEIEMAEGETANGNCDSNSQLDDQSEEKQKDKPSRKQLMSLMEQQVQVEKQLKEVENLIQAQQIAVEIITNMCSTEDNEDWEDVDSNSTDDNADDLSMETDLCGQEESVIKQENLQLSLGIHQSLISQGIISTVLSKCQGVVETEMLTGLSVHKLAHPIVKRPVTAVLVHLYGPSCQSFSGDVPQPLNLYLKQLQCYSLLCLSNLISVVDTSSESDGGRTLLGNMWQKLGLLFTTCSGTNEIDVDLLEAVTNALRSVLQKIADTEPSTLHQVTEADLKYLCDVSLSCQLAEIRAHIIRIVGCIGCALSKQPEPHAYLKGIGMFFCEVCSREKELWVIAECLDSMFDVFGEDHLNGIIKEIDLLEKLKAMVPNLKTKVKEQKKTLGEHAVIVNTAKNNLTRFIKYKSALIK